MTRKTHRKHRLAQIFLFLWTPVESVRKIIAHRIHRKTQLFFISEDIRGIREGKKSNTKAYEKIYTQFPDNVTIAHDIRTG